MIQNVLKVNNIFIFDGLIRGKNGESTIHLTL